jgi:aromatic-L-amino-acid/L-tryptophan decarboxylase
MNDRPDHTLTLSPDEMRAMGYRVVDLIVEHFAQGRDEPVTGGATRAELERRLREPPPEAGSGWRAALERARADVLGPMSHNDHPRFFAYVPGPGNFVGAMADALVAGINPFAGAWVTASGAAQVELVAVDWLRQWCGLPEGAGGAFVSGGSMANLTGLAVARWRRFGTEDFSQAIVYCSDQTHSSVHRAARVLGFRPAQVRVLGTDAGYRLPAEELRCAVEADRDAGRIPFCAVASAGTTNTGAVDPLPEIADVCRREGLWLHVDGAYGAPAVLTERGKALLAGLEHADSVSLDPHKWLFQPFEAGCILVRDARALRDAFRMVPEYLKDSDLAEEEVNFRDWGVQLTRSFRALKLWLTLQVFGLAAVREAVAWGMRLAEIAEDELRASPAWEVVTPAQLAIVTFRYAAPGLDAAALDGLQRRITAGMLTDGYAMLSTTELDGRAALRLCTINPRTTEEEVRETVRRLERIGRSLAA